MENKEKELSDMIQMYENYLSEDLIPEKEFFDDPETIDAVESYGKVEGKIEEVTDIIKRLKVLQKTA